MTSSNFFSTFLKHVEHRVFKDRMGISAGKELANTSWQVPDNYNEIKIIGGLEIILAL